MKTEEAFHLIVIDDSSNDAETVSNMLRNGGRAVRAIRVEDGETLREKLKDPAWDMILTKLEIPFFTAVETLTIVRDLKLDTPVILLHGNAAPGKIMEALQKGARDAVSLTDSARLEHVITREFADATARRRHRICEQQLVEANRRAQMLVDSSRDAIAYAHEGMHVYANESFLQMFGYSDFAEIEGMPLMNLVTPEDQGKFKELLRKLGKTASIDVRAIKSDASEFQITMQFSSTCYEGEECTQVLIQDQSLSKELAQRLDDISKQDLLTGLYNRRYFLDTLHRVVGSGTEEGALLFLEPDGFRKVLEEVGIAPSDMVIADLASVLQKSLVGTDILLARFEGPSFTLLITGPFAEKAEQIAETLVSRVSEHVCEVAGRSLSLTCSIGIAFFDEGITNSQEVLSRADKARRQMVEAGGNGRRTYNPAAEEMAEKEQAAKWGKKLKLALRDGTFYLVYQPVVSLHGDPAENYEVYLRMVDEGEEINPIDFLTAAEQAGLMVAVDRWVLHNAVRTLIERRRGGKNTSLFVNLSDASVKDPNLLPWMRELLKAARLDGSYLIVELTEGVAQANLRSAKALFDGLQQLHVRTSIDHFGTAVNSTHLLRHIQPAYLKLDGSLMAEFSRNVDQQRLIKELATQAKQAKCLTVAEFVEDANTLAALWSCGIDYIQGYFLQRPGRDLNYDFSSGGTSEF